MVPRPEMATHRSTTVRRLTLLIMSMCFTLSDRKWCTQTDNVQRLWLFVRRWSFLRFLFTCRRLSGFAGWAWLSVVRICWAVQLGYAHVQKESFLNVIDHCKSVTIAKSNSVKHMTDWYTLWVKSLESLRSFYVFESLVCSPRLHLLNRKCSKNSKIAKLPWVLSTFS